MNVPQISDTKVNRTLVFLAVLVFASIVWLVTPLVFENQGYGDSKKYLAIAADPFVFTESPWGYRLIVPWMAAGVSHILPVSLNTSFELVQFFGYLCCLLLLTHTSYKLKSSNLLVVMGMLLFTMGYQFIYYRHNFLHVGVWEFFFVGLLIWLLYLQNWRAVLVVLFISIFFKESVAFVFLQAIVAYWLLERYLNRRATLKLTHLLLICTLPLLAFLAVRLVFSAPDTAGSTSYLSSYNSSFFAKVFNGNFIGRCLNYVTVYGVLVYLLPISLRYARSSQFVLLNLLVLAFSATQLLLAIDSKRMACVGMISLIYIVFWLAEYTEERRRVIMFCFLHLVYSVGWLTQMYWLSYVTLILGAILLFSGLFGRPSTRIANLAKW